MDARMGIFFAYSGDESLDAGLPAIAGRQFCTHAAGPRAEGNYRRPIRHWRSSRLSPTGPRAGLFSFRYIVTLPLGLWIAAVVAVSPTTRRPSSSQIKPVSS